MFEGLIARAAAAAGRRAAAKRLEIAERLAEEVPAGVRVEAGAEGVILSAPALGRRPGLASALRWIVAGAVR